MTKTRKGWLNDWENDKDETAEKTLKDLTYLKPYDTFKELSNNRKDKDNGRLSRY